MADGPIIDRINQLAHEEEQLWQRASDGGGLTTDDQQRLKVVGIELDQCYDLLRQRQARREFGQDPDQAEARPAEIVENYRQGPNPPARRRSIPRSRRAGKAAPSARRPTAGGSTFDAVRRAAISAAATHRPRSTRRATPKAPTTRSSRASSPARSGSTTTRRTRHSRVRR